ncbi:MAG TPA: hypothetical protein VM101_05635 [Flavitalea sp.]|nr:hypothetical protein [Flavitalea sp.]
MKNIPLYTLVFSVFIFIYACNKNDTSINSTQLNEYIPLQTGKYIHYRLDSTIFIDFGQRDTVISYDAKDIVDGELTDNLGRQTFRVIRYLRHIASTNEGDYTAGLTYFVTPSSESVELQEENLKFQKLRLPVNNGFNWHGNAYLPSTPYFALYQFSNDEDIDVWDYTYMNVNEPVTINEITYDSTVTVQQVADSANVPIEFPDGLAYRNYWSETYAKNIGLIYKEVVMWEYQPPNSGNPGFRSGFGIKLSIIDHN